MAASAITRIEIRSSVLRGCVDVVECAGQRAVIGHNCPESDIEKLPCVRRARKAGLPVEEKRS